MRVCLYVASELMCDRLFFDKFGAICCEKYVFMYVRINGAFEQVHSSFRSEVASNMFDHTTNSAAAKWYISEWWIFVNLWR